MEAGHIKRLLVDYERCSGQAVSLMKSGIYFSSNIRRDKQTEISEILGVYNEITKTKYIGLPSFVGRSKRRVFNYLKDEATGMTIETYVPSREDCFDSKCGPNNTLL